MINTNVVILYFLADRHAAMLQDAYNEYLLLQYFWLGVVVLFLSFVCAVGYRALKKEDII